MCTIIYCVYDGLYLIDYLDVKTILSIWTIIICLYVFCVGPMDMVTIVSFAIDVLNVQKIALDTSDVLAH
jgi:hypothetical protein